MNKIKTFNVNEDIYNTLLSIFKKYETKTSLSAFVNNCLTELLEHIQLIEQLAEKHPDFKVPMSFVITEMVKSLQNKKALVSVALFDVDIPEQEREELYETELLAKWEDAYESHKLGISVGMYSYLKSGAYNLSSNKQYLIDDKSGKKFIVIELGGDRTFLAEIQQS